MLASAPGELHSRLALHSLDRLGKVLERRRAYAGRLVAWMQEQHPGRFLPQRIPDGVLSNWQNLAMRVPETEQHGIDGVIEALARRGVEARRYFHPTLDQLPQFGGRFELPNTSRLANTLVCLPLHSEMDDDTLGRVEQALSGLAADLA